MHMPGAGTHPNTGKRGHLVHMQKRRHSPKHEAAAWREGLAPEHAPQVDQQLVAHAGSTRCVTRLKGRRHCG